MANLFDQALKITGLRSPLAALETLYLGATNPAFRKQVQGKQLTPEEVKSLASRKNLAIDQISQDPSQIKKQVGADMVRAASFAVPFGKGANIASKVLLPGAYVGGLSEAADQGESGEFDPTNLALSMLSGAGMAGAMNKGGKLLQKGVSKGSKAIATKQMESLFKQPLKDTKAAVRGGQTLGQEALERGVKGKSTQSIYKNTLSKLGGMENQIKKHVSKSDKTIDLNVVLDKVSPFINKLKDAGNTAQADKLIDRIIKIADASGEKIPVAKANQVKRTLYKEVRNNYGKLSSERIEGLKKVANILKDEIADAVPQIGKINNDYSFLIRAEESLADKIAREGRNNAIGLTDAMLASPSLLVGPAGFMPAAINKLIGTTGSKTYSSQALNQLTKTMNNPNVTKIAQQLLGQLGGRTNLLAMQPNNQPNQQSPNDQGANSPFVQTPPPIEGVSYSPILANDVNSDLPSFSGVGGGSGQPQDGQVSPQGEWVFSAEQGDWVPNPQKFGQPQMGNMIDPNLINQVLRVAALQDLEQTGGKNIIQIQAAMELFKAPEQTDEQIQAQNLNSQIDFLKQLYKPGEKNSLSAGKTTTGLGGVAAKGKQEIRKRTDQDYQDRLTSYKQMLALAIGVINQARQAGVLNAGEAEQLLVNMPNEHTSEAVATEWFKNAKSILGQSANFAGGNVLDDSLMMTQ